MSAETPYRPAEIEARWQRRWDEARSFAVPAAAAASRPKYYVLEMFPYPSGRIHMGHVRNYSIGDVLARFKRARGFDVLHPMGWDAFGLPAENAAIKHGKHPAAWTWSNIATMREQLKRLGFAYDWDREVATCDPAYYRFEQRVFIEMLDRGLAYKKAGLLNWCESCQTTLANEQVEDGNCWRCGNLVVQREMEQWFLRITKYADELLAWLSLMPGWPQAVLSQQDAWIGRSEGAAIDFELEPEVLGIEGISGALTVFTTRPDTLYGCTFLSLAPEHPWTRRLAAGTAQAAAVSRFVDEMGRTDKAVRIDEAAEKRGVFTGRYAIHPLDGRRIPIWTANFVLAEYGTGAVMAVPAHDQRDFEFASKYGLPKILVIRPPSVEGAASEFGPDVAAWPRAWVDAGTMTASGPHEGLRSEPGKKAVVAELVARGRGRATVSFRLRDWGISRQRYWGCPVPVVYCQKDGMQPVPKEQLPVVLPEDVVLDGQGGSPLQRNSSFLESNCPKCGGPARRETDTFDTFMESSWYYLRYCSPKSDSLVEPAEAARWMPVDQYIGGIEHAVMHLLYARFYTKVLRDLGYLRVDEPFQNLLCQGMVCHETYRVDGEWIHPSEVDGGKHVASGRPVEVGRVEKMSKSKKNTVEPDVMIDRFGADTMRLFCLFAAPPQKDLDWSDAGVEGCFRFLTRVWRLCTRRAELVRSQLEAGRTPPAPETLPPAAAAVRRATHRTIARVTDDIERRMQFNTAIAAVMELMNEIAAFEAPEGKERGLSDDEAAVLAEAATTVVRLLSPFAPHVADELWEQLGGRGWLEEAAWPSADAAVAKEDVVSIAVQVQGKLRGQLELPAGAPQVDVEAAALALPAVQKHLDGRAVRRVIVVPGKLVNVVPG
jgi:leucyl-tRNA synthetase